MSICFSLNVELKWFPQFFFSFLEHEHNQRQSCASQHSVTPLTSSSQILFLWGENPCSRSLYNWLSAQRDTSLWNSHYVVRGYICLFCDIVKKRGKGISEPPMPMDDAGCPGRLWLAAIHVPRQIFIGGNVDQGTSSWEWVIDQWQLTSQWHFTYSFYSWLWWLICFLLTVSEEGQWFWIRFWRNTLQGWVTYTFPSESRADSPGNSWYPGFKFRFLCRWWLLRPKSQTQMISITTFFIPVRRQSCLWIKTICFHLCLDFIHRIHFFFSWIPPVAG